MRPPRRKDLYYGAKIGDIDLRYTACRGIGPFSIATVEAEEYALDAINGEYPSANEGDYRTAAISVENADGTKGNRLRYKSHRIYAGKEPIEGLPFSRSAKESETLAVLLTDEQKGIEVEVFYTVYPAQDVITRYQKIINRAKSSAYIEKAASLCVDFNETEYDMLELTGVYGYERGIVQRLPLQKGVRTSGTTIGASSHYANPFFALIGKNTDEHSGDAYGFNLVYSGSFLNEVEVDRCGKVRAVSGINPAGFRWELKQGESFTTPEAIMTYS